MQSFLLLLLGNTRNERFSLFGNWSYSMTGLGKLLKVTWPLHVKGEQLRKHFIDGITIKDELFLLWTLLIAWPLSQNAIWIIHRYRPRSRFCNQLRFLIESNSLSLSLKICPSSFLSSTQLHSLLYYHSFAFTSFIKDSLDFRNCPSSVRISNALVAATNLLLCLRLRAFEVRSFYQLIFIDSNCRLVRMQSCSVTWKTQSDEVKGIYHLNLLTMRLGYWMWERQ